MNVALILLQETVADSTNRAPDANIWFWGASQVVITLIIFVGVYFIFKPVFGKKEKETKDISEN